MATLNFTVDEALNILRANARLPESISDVRSDGDGLLLTVRGGITVRLRVESFSGGVLNLSFGSNNWAFKLADSLGKVDGMLDGALRGFPFIRRQGNSLAIDLNRALQGYVRGIQVKDFELRSGSLRIEF